MNEALKKYADGGHQTVHGWLSQTAVDMTVAVGNAQLESGLRGSVAEIGVHHGRFFVLLSLLTRVDELSVAWDLFERQDENVDRSGKGNKEVFLQNVARNGCDLGRIKALTANSEQLKPADVLASCDGPVRIFSVDGGHTAKLTLSDIKLAAEAAASGGVMILDDVFNENWPEVVEGVFQYFADTNVKWFPVAIGGNKYFFTTSPEHAKRYQDSLAALSTRYDLKWVTMFGQQVLVIYPPPNLLVHRLKRMTLVQHLKQSAIGKALKRFQR